ncbi:hypothetical protein HYDPIDRAFT_41142 [Hydnomerulius pinastri MD-312]|uniref:L-dopachrome isomerase n=1 Tax=Hydnomerulius pinastri MD-312 TaxID=994086 RepID=A0A0C9WEG1_9AGAM|nr:hypothetical protein HYDPIDRAFT_41142 [Hydnomerulius pinastri MD-312]
MPLITLITNLDQPRLFISKFSKFCSQTIGKPEAEFSVDFNYNPDLTFGGTFDPAIRLHVISLWNTTPENAQQWAEAFFRFFQDELGVPSNRGHMAFTDPGDQFIGYGGTTVSVLRAEKK